MRREVSVFLDLTRFLAAFLVFLSHASWMNHSGGMLWQLGGVGREAVDVFFVLSGFVMAHVVAGRHISARDYAINRIARIASVAVPALVVTWLLDGVGMGRRAEIYAASCCDPGWLAYGRNLIFTGDVWWWHVSPGSNVPYWSLGFEAWYYLAFGLLVFLPGVAGIAAAALAMAVAGPGIAALFPLWLLGVGCYRGCQRPVSEGVGWGLFLSGWAVILAVAVFGVRRGQIYDGFELSWGRMADYGHDYATGLGFVLVLIGFSAICGRFSAVSMVISRPIRWLAGATFALYLFHLPMLHFLAAMLPWPGASWQARVVIYVGVPLMALGLAEVTERRKSWWRKGLVAIWLR